MRIVCLSLETVLLGVSTHIASLVTEQYFARSLGFAQLTLGLVVVCLTGAIPLTSLVDGKHCHGVQKPKVMGTIHFDVLTLPG